MYQQNAVDPVHPAEKYPSCMYPYLSFPGKLDPEDSCQQPLLHTYACVPVFLTSSVLILRSNEIRNLLVLCLLDRALVVLRALAHELLLDKVDAYAHTHWSARKSFLLCM